jgi:hypothetical protein
MSNGAEINNELEFEDRWRDMDMTAKIDWMGHYIYKQYSGQCIMQTQHEARLEALEKKPEAGKNNGVKGTVVSALPGGIAGVLVSIIIGVVEYFRTIGK